MTLRVTLLVAALVASAGCHRQETQAPPVSPRAVTPDPIVHAEVVAAAAPVPVGECTQPAKPAVLPIVASYSTSMANGKARAARGDVRGARQQFEAAARFHPDRAAPYIELATLYIGTGDHEAAKTAANAAVAREADSNDAWDAVGRASYAASEYEAAVSAFHTSIVVDNSDVSAWNDLGLAQLEVHRYGEAVDSFQHATDLPDATPDMWNNLGTAYEHSGRLEDAKNAFAAGAWLGSDKARVNKQRVAPRAS
jgi:tetratricopeptide (TPR) repeat protein